MGISPKLVPFLQNIGFDAVHAYNIGLAKSSDKTILDYAISHNHILLTSDLDFCNIVAVEGIIAPGLIVMRIENPTVEAMMSNIDNLLKNIGIKELKETIAIIEPHRIRKRKMPIIAAK